MKRILSIFLFAFLLFASSFAGAEDDKKITDFDSYTPSSSDVIPVVDVANDITKKATISGLFGTLSGITEGQLDWTSGSTLPYLAGITGYVQTQINNIGDNISGLTEGQLDWTSGVTLPRLSGVTDNVQDQFNNLSVTSSMIDWTSGSTLPHLSGVTDDVQDQINSIGTAASHAASHIKDGADEIDGDQLDIDFTPSNYTPTTDPAEASDADHLTAHLAGIDDAIATAGQVTWAYQRPQFSYNGGVTAYTVNVGAAAYYCKDKYAYWDSELTTSAISTPAANTHYYLYLDYSAITSNTEITADELIWSTTAPSWNGTYKGRYNGDDRCIFAAKTDDTPTNILEFWHDGGDLVMLADEIEILPRTDIDTTWTDVTTGIPGFSIKAMVTFVADTPATTANTGRGYWRTNGQTGNTGHRIGQAFYNGAEWMVTTVNSIPVMTDVDGIFEVKYSLSQAHTLEAYLNGWYFPAGM